MESSDGSGSISRSADVPSCVQVALRIRPQGTREKLEGSHVCTSVIPNEPQVVLGAEKSFTYDYVFDQAAQQTSIYDSCISRLVEGLFDGYNATVLAYGQTGSGKTYTMGTAFNAQLDEEQKVGVIPRAIDHVFRKISSLKVDAHQGKFLEPSFEVSVQFIELYNEEIIDLLVEDRTSQNIKIGEDSNGQIILYGATGRNVTDLASTVEILKNGAVHRSIGETKMNAESSRSHAIFSMHIKQQRVSTDTAAGQAPEMEVLSAKFHFVDLAGSERLKRTGATGDRAKEGISINCGLLALGNVISALGGASGKVSHVPYRDSKLTRLLQDSLGGNSRTLMIACVSPSDSDFVETLNTLKYANRAKNIKNKVVANQDKSSKMIGELRGRIASLEAELLEFKQGRRTVNEDGAEVTSDQYHENVMLTAEVNQLRLRVKALQETNEILRGRNVELMTAKDLAMRGRSNGSDEDGNATSCDDDPIQATLRGYLEENERLRSSLFESQVVADQMRKETTRWKQQALHGVGASPRGDSPFGIGNTQQRLVEEARADLERMKKSVTEVTSDYTSAQSDNLDDDGTSNDADELDDEEAMELDDDSPVEESQESVMLRNNLVDIQQDISIKERLIEELERSEQRMREVRLTYEKKLTELSARIKQTEAERDRILAESVEKQQTKGSQEQAKRIRDEYERKILEMKNEFKKLQSLEREHKQMQMKQERERMELQRFKGELDVLKKNKVELVKQLREENKKAQMQQATNAKKVAALDKESRKKDNMIRTLQQKDKQREEFMKRTTEEIGKLRLAQRAQDKRGRGGSTASSRTPLRAVNTPVSRVAGRGQVPQKLTFSPKNARLKWGLIESKISRLVVQKIAVNNLEVELQKWLKQRHEIVDEIISLERRFNRADDVEERAAIGEELDGCRQRMNYVQDQIQDTQAAMVEVDTLKDGSSEEEQQQTATVESIIEHCSNLVEAKYLLQHLFSLSLESAVTAAKHEASNKENEARVQQLEQQSYINEQLLTTVLEGGNEVREAQTLAELGRKKVSRSSSQASLRAASGSPALTDAPSDSLASYKIRRHTATADELLYPSESTTSVDTPSQEESPTVETKEAKKERKRSEMSAYLMPAPAPVRSPTSPSTSDPFARNGRFRRTTGSIPSKMTAPVPTAVKPPPRQPNSVTQIIQKFPIRGGMTRTAQLRSSTRLSSLAEVEHPTPSTSTTNLRSSASSASVASTSSARTSADPPPSSLMQRRNSLRNGGGAVANGLNNNGNTCKKGGISAVRSGGPSRIVSRTHTLEGHAKDVMCVAATNELLLTGSKDRTVKLWDLAACREVRTLGLHPNNVTAVRFIADSNLAISVSMYQVRVWDTRTHECVRLLHSSGQITDGDMAVGSRQNTVPFLETVIQAVEVDRHGCLLFTSFAEQVRIWNLEKWASFGRLNSATHTPGCEVTCLALADGQDGGCRAFAASRDHFIKVYETRRYGDGMYEATAEINGPQHVTSLLPFENSLFVAAKDKTISKFSLSDNKRDHLETSAHEYDIKSMVLMKTQRDPVLCSSDKGGVVKFWDICTSRRTRILETVKAHSESVNNMCCNDSLLFTASSDQTVGFWKINGTA